MSVTFDENLLHRSPGIPGLMKTACQLLQVKPHRIHVRGIKGKGYRGQVRRLGQGWLIEVAELVPEQMLRTLVHELVHVKQYTEGRLKRTETGWIWGDKFYPWLTPYAERPWEQEAHLVAKRTLMYLKDVA